MEAPTPLLPGPLGTDPGDLQPPRARGQLAPTEQRLGQTRCLHTCRRARRGPARPHGPGLSGLLPRAACPPARRPQGRPRPLCSTAGELLPACRAVQFPCGRRAGPLARRPHGTGPGTPAVLGTRSPVLGADAGRTHLGTGQSLRKTNAAANRDTGAHARRPEDSSQGTRGASSERQTLRSLSLLLSPFYVTDPSGAALLLRPLQAASQPGPGPAAHPPPPTMGCRPDTPAHRRGPGLHRSTGPHTGNAGGRSGTGADSTRTSAALPAALPTAPARSTSSLARGGRAQGSAPSPPRGVAVCSPAPSGRGAPRAEFWLRGARCPDSCHWAHVLCRGRGPAARCHAARCHAEPSRGPRRPLGCRREAQARFGPTCTSFTHSLSVQRWWRESPPSPSPLRVTEHGQPRFCRSLPPARPRLPLSLAATPS